MIPSPEDHAKDFGFREKTPKKELRKRKQKDTLDVSSLSDTRLVRELTLTSEAVAYADAYGDRVTIRHHLTDQRKLRQELLRRLKAKK